MEQMAKDGDTVEVGAPLMKLSSEGGGGGASGELAKVGRKRVKRSSFTSKCRFFSLCSCLVRILRKLVQYAVCGFLGNRVAFGQG